MRLPRAGRRIARWLKWGVRRRKVRPYWKENGMTQDQFDPEEVARFENDTWSRCAQTYMDGFGVLVGAAIGPLLNEVEVSDQDRVLDVGTGPGLVAAAAAERGAEVIG